MHYSTASILAASLAPLAAARLGKPIINPEFPNGGLGSLGGDLLNNLHPTHSNSDMWGNDYLPKDCKDIAGREGFSPFDIEAFNIYYDDCPGNSWVFCRHKSGPLSKIDMIDIFGRLPVRSRSYVRHIMSVPGNPSAYNLGDNILLRGGLDITHYVHEISHSLDSNAFDPKYGVPFHTGSVWVDNYNQDSAVVDYYAQGSQQENLAQIGVVSLYDKVVPGGISNKQPNWKAIFHQYATFQGYIGDAIIPGGQCPGRLINSAPVRKDGGAARVAASSQPKLKNGVPEIPARPQPSTVLVTEFDDAGNAVGSRIEKV